MSSNSSSLLLPSIFMGENYHLWTAKKSTYLKAHNLWDIIENEMTKEDKTLAIIRATLQDDLSRSILMEEFSGVREFEALKIKEYEDAKEFSNKLSKVVTQVKLLGEKLNNKRDVEINFGIF
ncbi:hypothetical protein CR513_29125, partial [Mucuna pruriens]